jgi:hypothetical protein
MRSQIIRDLEWLIETKLPDLMKKNLRETFTWEREFDENLREASILSSEQLGVMLSECWKWRGENDLM